MTKSTEKNYNIVKNSTSLTFVMWQICFNEIDRFRCQQTWSMLFSLKFVSGLAAISFKLLGVDPAVKSEKTGSARRIATPKSCIQASFD